MKLVKSLSSAITAVALVGSFASAQAAGYTREQVRAELAEAVRNGDILAESESGLTLRELYPHRYPARLPTTRKTREQVRTELVEATRSGDILADGERHITLRELFPHRYPAREVSEGKSREQVRAELDEAVRTGDMLANGEQGLTLRELYPQRYPARTSSAANVPVQRLSSSGTSQLN